MKLYDKALNRPTYVYVYRDKGGFLNIFYVYVFIINRAVDNQLVLCLFFIRGKP